MTEPNKEEVKEGSEGRKEGRKKRKEGSVC